MEAALEKLRNIRYKVNKLDTITKFSHKMIIKDILNTVTTNLTPEEIHSYVNFDYKDLSLESTKKYYDKEIRLINVRKIVKEKDIDDVDKLMEITGEQNIKILKGAIEIENNIKAKAKFFSLINSKPVMQMNNGMALQCVKNQTDDICLAAIRFI